MLPRVKINFANGALGSVEPSPDGLVGMLAPATEIVDAADRITFALGKIYTLRSLDDLKDLGLTANTTDEKTLAIYRNVEAFYANAGNGAELLLYGYDSDSYSDPFVTDIATDFIKKAAGRLRFLVWLQYSLDPYSFVEGGLASEAQVVAEWATNSLFAPIHMVMQTETMPDPTQFNLKTCNFNRVSVLCGKLINTTTVEMEGEEPVVLGVDYLLGVLAGRLAANPVQRHIGRVKDGALRGIKDTPKVYDMDTSDDLVLENSQAETLNELGYISLRTFVGKAGYFFTDDPTATAIADDYHSICNRRIADKAYRIVYTTLLEHINEELPVTDQGYPSPSVLKSLETEIISAIARQMTANGELGADPSDTGDKGVRCYINPQQNIVATSTLNINVQVKPYGYAKYINVELGFTLSEE